MVESYLSASGDMYSNGGLHEAASYRSLALGLGREYASKLPQVKLQRDYLDKVHELSGVSQPVKYNPRSILSGNRELSDALVSISYRSAGLQRNACSICKTTYCDHHRPAHHSFPI